MSYQSKYTGQEIEEKLDNILSLDKIYPVNSIYMSYSHTSPASLFGGTWTRIENAFLWGIPSTAYIGTTGGSQTHTLTVNEMPSHTHTFTGSSATTSSAGAHTHTTSGTAASAGAHTHTRGTMNITGAIDAVLMDDGRTISTSGAFSKTLARERSWSGATGSASYTINLNAANNWSGSTSSAGAHTHTTSGTAASAGAHTHTLTAKGSNSNTGGGAAHSIMPPYIQVSIWRRTA